MRRSCAHASIGKRRQTGVWVVVQAGKKLAVPPEAYREYGFQAGEEIVFTRGSRRSGGFGIGRVATIPPLLKKRVLAQGRMGKKGQVVLPPEVEM